ncbi:methylthioribulose 1-phosphate dehydratase [Yinghuangia seranimata]|uniref:methylthioribulose 1-phosphate dehydratase n=1 Tax=Yinghuangia seranimata TaxID=408067 RepID=UPI00248CF34B|nr:methylthioribulose 1-phosphate dehydratase [Yinghuangia seranimata]MDI2125989.1 methylthioribulose 1-phosphate dehydratase [Yinghuangia seranimata]
MSSPVSPASPTPAVVTAADRAAAGMVLAQEAARFAGLGWMRGTSGNLSVVVSRDPVRLAVTGSGLDKGELGPDDLVVVDGAGVPVPADQGPGTPRKPSAEAALHARVVALTGAGAVFHVHTLQAVQAGARWPGGIELRDLEMLKGIGRSAHDETVTIPVIANSQDMGELGDRLEAAMVEGVPAVVVASHGMYVWGADPMQARHHVEVVQWLLEYRVAEG